MLTLDAMPEILTAPKIAEYLGIGKKKVYELIKTGKIRGFNVGYQVRVDKADFIQWLQSQKNKKVG